MPLSEHEQELLEQMEQALYAEDPKFASQMQGAGARSARRRYIIGGLGVLVGLGLVLTGISTTMWIGAGGFVVMVAAITYAATPPRRRKTPLGTVQTDGSIRQAAKPAGASRMPRAAQASRPAKSRQGTFMQRLEQRWERRRNNPY